MSHKEWLPLRERAEYKSRGDDLDNALNEYWMDDKNLDVIERICITSYRFLTYIASELTSFQPNHANEIPGIYDAITGFYSVSQSFQDQVDALEVLSRSAYMELKNGKKNDVDSDRDLM